MIKTPHGLNTPEVSGLANTQVHSLDSLSTEEFLKVVGMRVRNQRSAMSMSRKRLAEVSGVSERYLAQLESGQGNMSIALLRKVTSAIDMSMASLLSGETPELDRNDDNRLQKQSIAADSRHHAAINGTRPFQPGNDLSGRTGKLVTDR